MYLLTKWLHSFSKRVQTASWQTTFREKRLDNFLWTKALLVLAGQKSLMRAIKVSCTSAFVSASVGKINCFVYHVLCQWQC